MKKFFIGVCITSAFIFGTCFSQTVSARNKDLIGFKIYNIHNTTSYVVNTIIDEKTGVNYLSIFHRGNSDRFSVVPRYNADGTLYVSEVK